MASDRKTRPFVAERLATKCMTCLDEEIRDWIHECLIATRDANGVKPTASLIHREVQTVFPTRAPAHENSTRRHLRDHEPAFFGWKYEED